MANVSVYNMEGNEVGTLELNDAVFGVNVNEHRAVLGVLRRPNVQVLAVLAVSEMAAYPKFFTVKRIDLGILVKAPVLVAAGTELGGVVNALPVLYRPGIFPTGGGGVANATVLQVVLQLQP